MTHISLPFENQVNVIAESKKNTQKDTHVTHCWIAVGQNLNSTNIRFFKRIPKWKYNFEKQEESTKNQTIKVGYVCNYLYLTCQCKYSCPIILKLYQAFLARKSFYVTCVCKAMNEIVKGMRDTTNKISLAQFLADTYSSLLNKYSKVQSELAVSKNGKIGSAAWKK